MLKLGGWLATRHVSAEPQAKLPVEPQVTGLRAMAIEGAAAVAERARHRRELIL